MKMIKMMARMMRLKMIFKLRKEASLLSFNLSEDSGKISEEIHMFRNYPWATNRSKTKQSINPDMRTSKNSSSL
jgi:hypothetical protein